MTAAVAAPPKQQHPSSAAAGSENGTSQTQLVTFPHLASPNNYEPCTFNYYTNASKDSANPVGLAEWIEVFRKSIPTFAAHAAADTSLQESHRVAGAARFAEAFAAVLDAVLADPLAEIPGFPKCQPISCLTLCAMRERCLHTAGFTDVFKSVKQREDEAALQLLPQVLARLDAVQGRRAALEAALRGVFAGNIFDLGAAASAKRYADGGGAGFDSALAQLLPRPWVVDHLDAALDALCSGRHRLAVLFVDNAGADVLLGMLPFARELLKGGAQVLLAANRGPTINDITAAELLPLLVAAAAADTLLHQALQSGALHVVDSGNDLPVIDLRAVSSELAAAVADADLVVLEGMGRAIETNLTAAFTVDALKLGMIKHPEVAACLGGRMYDCVCRFDPACGGPSGGAFGSSDEHSITVAAPI